MRRLISIFLFSYKGVGFSLIVYLLLLLIISSSKPFVVIETQISAQTSAQIFVVDQGWHTSIIVHSNFIKQQIPELSERFKNKKFIEFGWGDKGFYQASEMGIKLILKALFWPTESVIHAVGFSTHPLKYFKNSRLVSLHIDAKQYTQLIAFIKQSFKKNQHGAIMAQDKGIYGDSQFYNALGDYYYMNTCNTWTAKALKSAGIPISPTFKLTSASVMDTIGN